MLAEHYSHRYADIILNADYDLRKEINDVVRFIDFNEVERRYQDHNAEMISKGKKTSKGRQAMINLMFREQFRKQEWEVEKNVFDDPENDLKMDFWKRRIGVDVAFNHRSFIGGDLLRLQAAAEVKNVIKVGVYICPVKSFAKVVSPKDSSSMVSFERAIWYLENFYSVLTVPILLIGLRT
jgi:Restriction endonuclease BglII